MAMSGTYVKEGRKIEGCYAVVFAVTASKFVGVQARVHVYWNAPKPEVLERRNENNEVTQAFVPMQRGGIIDEFTLSTPYVPGEDSVVTAYNALAEDERFAGWKKV